MQSNRDYMTENENLKKQIKQLKEKNRETIFDEEFFRTLGGIE